MRIGIIGAGALGLYYGAMLQRGGQDVHYLMRRDLEAVRRSGLRVTSPRGDFHLSQPAIYGDAARMGAVDLVVVGLKTYANNILPHLIAPLLGPQTAILTLQNGLGNEELLAESFGAERVLGGVAFLCSNRGEPGTVHHLGEGRIRLGEFAGGFSDRARTISNCFREAGVPCETVDDLRRARWEKLVWNIPFNGLCALTGYDVTELLSHRATREQIEGLMREVVEGANAQGLRESIDGPSLIERMLEMSDAMDHYRPSMMVDRLEGRSLEIKAIYDIPVEYARRAGVEMERVGMLSALLALGEQP
ncbi:MAG TPA: putative 2-dehydropantoate 2-reductase [Desulfuromonadales bacterium]|nr:putative 2-dehydropantoate 2-reductase [Desulfuromonadales bacterium]